MDKVIYLNSLYDVYKDLLTDKQKEYYELYYFDNLSLGEIAENCNVSRNAVHNQIKIIEEKLLELESKLKLKEKQAKILKILEKKSNKELYEEIKRII
jgi:predicted DNA-binding protein YlxM (UPF0122 family)